MKTKASSVFYALLIGLLVVSSSCSKDDPINVPVLTTKEVTNITNTTAVSGGSITDDGGALVTARGVCWSKSKTPTIKDSKTVDGTGLGSFISNLSGLEPNTTYHVRSYATNGKNTGYGGTYSFTLQSSQFTDSRDDNVYKIVFIGRQVWMAENLKYLPAVVGSATGSNTTWYYYVYGYDGKDLNAAKATANYKTYGVLYNWAAAMAGSKSSTANPSRVKGVCPTGWHLPSDAEWKQLHKYLGTAEGGKLKETGTTHWLSPNKGATNETGFTALPGGLLNDSRKFNAVGTNGHWWCATESDYMGAMGWFMGNNYHSLASMNWSEMNAFSVRCVRD